MALIFVISMNENELSEATRHFVFKKDLFWIINLPTAQVPILNENEQ